MSPKILPPLPEGSLAAALDEVDELLEEIATTVECLAYETPSPEGEVVMLLGDIRKRCDAIEEVL